MSRKGLVRLAIIAPLLALLVLLDALPALQGLPLLAVALGLAFLVTDRIRTRLKDRERPGLAMLPFMAAALVLLLLFCRGRNLHQLLLLAVTIAVVFDVLLVALAAIGETSKRGLKGILEFGALTAAGLLLGLVLSLVFLMELIRFGGASLAEP